MIESRCGIVCGECVYKEEIHCAGCVNIAKPFWGESCPVKNCCEDRHIDNCGRCDKFPCDLLKQFSYDKEQGDDGERIKQCAKWCKGE